MTFNKYLNEKNQMVVDIEIVDNNGVIYAVRRYAQSTSYHGIGNVNMSSDIACTFVNEMPTLLFVRGGSLVIHGYLLYDIENELFAGADGEWKERVKYILIPANKDGGWSPSSDNKDTLELLDTGDEVVIVPCISYESRVDGDLFIYQKFDWKWAVGLKSRSGVLPIMQS